MYSEGCCLQWLYVASIYGKATLFNKIPRAVQNIQDTRNSQRIILGCKYDFLRDGAELEAGAINF